MLSILPKYPKHKTTLVLGFPTTRAPKDRELITKNRKSQTSIELLAFFSVAVLIFSITYTIIFEKTQEAYDSKSGSEAARIGGTIASEIDTAVSEGDGYSKNITLPGDIFGAKYNVSMEPGYVFVRWREKNAVLPTIANVTGNFTSGNNYIKNKGGVIFAN
ncbi:Uncharacterised protein [uncultured archaeon]|nr:Uncharacterised protein [uncultured archaeon]